MYSCVLTPSAKQLTVMSGRGKCSGGGGIVTIGTEMTKYVDWIDVVTITNHTLKRGSK